MPPRAIDHLVLPSRDLAGMAEIYRRLGFTVGSRNRHPWGTENHIIQFDGSFLELLGFADDYRPLPDDDPASPFAGFVADHLTRAHDDIAMVVLRSADAGLDAEQFRAAGIGRGRLLPFSRMARDESGHDKTVAFTVAFAEAETMPGIGFFTCQQHRPENFWNPAAQVHANGALAVEAVTIVAADPATALGFLTAFGGSNQVRTVSDGFELALDNGRIELLTAAAFQQRFPVAAIDRLPAPHVGAATISVRSLDGVRAHLATQDLTWVEAGAAVVVQPFPNVATRLIFRAA